MAGLVSLLFCIAVVIFLAKLFSSASQKLPKTKRPPTDLTEEENNKILPFEKKKYLMTQTEHKFFDVLQNIIGDKHFIEPQVALSRIIEVKDNGQGRYGPGSWFSNFNRINKKSVDFVIFDKQDFSPQLVIELDDYTHNYYNRRQRDEFLDEALKAADLNILHVKPQYNYDTNQLEKVIFSKLKTYNKQST